MKYYNFTEQDVYDFYMSGPYSVPDVANAFNISVPTARKMLISKGNLKTRQELCNYGLRLDYFDNIDDEFKAYYLGLLIADGCVFKKTNRTYQVSLQLQKCDSYMVEQFKNSVCAPRKIVVDKRDDSASITITSNRFCRGLVANGVVPNKTKRTTLPNIPDNLMHHLIRGVFDGDGCIVKVFPHEGHTIGYRVSIVGTYTLLSAIHKYIVAKTDISNNKVYCEPTPNLYRITWGAWGDVITFCDFIYKDATIGLNRKHDIYLDCLYDAKRLGKI